MSYRLIIQPPALDDLEQAYRWIAERAPETGARWLNRFHEALGTLSLRPRRCPLAPESGSVGREIREFLYGRRGGVYRVLFAIRGREVRILHIRHAARQPLAPEELDLRDIEPD
jgi:plasmid stabilization system protein ParE